MQRTENPNNSSFATQPVLTLPNGKPANPWLILASLTFGFFMSLLDVTIVNIALPNIVTKLNTDLTTVTWVLNAYNLAFAVLLITVGRFADQFGSKLIFMVGMVIFSVGSLLCALSPSIGWLIGFRAFQAIGAASLNPVSLAIITAVFPREKRGAAIGVWGATSGIATAIGPVLGGFLVQNFDWRWIFFVNLPFCVVGLIMVGLFVPSMRHSKANQRIDLLGVLLLSVTLFCLVLGVTEGNGWGWTSTGVLGLFGGALVGLILFVIAELKQADPIVDFSLFKIRSFVSSDLSMFLFGIAIQGAFVILVLYFISARGYDQLTSAYNILPIPLASFVVAALSGSFSRKINPRYLGIAGLIIMSIGLGSLVTLSADASTLDTIWRGLIIGAGMGMCFQSFPNFALTDVPRPKLGVGSGIFNTFRQVGFALGVAILISLFTSQVTTNVNQARQNAAQIALADTRLPLAMRQGIASGLRNSTSSTVNVNGFGPVDLTYLADRVPGPAGQALKPELKSLGNRIAAEFQAQVVDAFKTTWLLATGFGVAGVLVSLLTGRTRRKLESPPESNPIQEAEDIPAALG